ncbi:MAG: endonuclease/exonuclease/phosphatase family protein [Bacillota bacterium]
MLLRASVLFVAGLLSALCIPTTQAAPTQAGTVQPAQLASLAQQRDSLSVMSFNMWHKDRPDQLKTMANQLRTDLKQLPDFILCQEVVFGRGRAEDNTAAVLGNQFGYYSRGTKRTSDREGIAIISRYPFAYYSEKHLKAQTSRLLFGFNRVSVMGEFLVPGIGRVRVVDVHLTNWGFEHHIRRKQLQETLAWISERETQVPAAVTILGGDFNAKSHWDEMKQIPQADATGRIRFLNFNSDVPSMGSLGSPNKRIDHIFVSAATSTVQLLQEKLFWKEGLRDGSSRFYVSDHLCLLHVYSFKNPSVASATPN